jgi:hypothetical protein
MDQLKHYAIGNLEFTLFEMNPVKAAKGDSGVMVIEWCDGD